MVRNYMRKTDRGNYGSNSLTAALKAVRDGTPLIKVSREYGIPPRTLRRHRDQKVSNPGTIQMGRHKTVFSDEDEKVLKDHVIDMERRMFGLTTKDLRRLAFDVAEKAGLHHPFNKESGMAGTDWLSRFLDRNNLSLRQPQATSMSRVVGFNKPKVDQFFELLKSEMEQNNYSASKVWNMDETALTTVQKPSKIMAEKGVRQVGKVTSAERGELVTFFCAMNAAGGYLPPMYVFPRKRMVDVLMTGAPPGSVGYVTETGWSDSERFLKWLNHFADVTNASKESKQIIILDGHHSHKTLAAVDYCRNHGIELLTLPPHSTHKMQPLDRCYFKSLKSAYNACADSWMVANPGQRITIYKIAELSRKAFLSTATPEKAVNGFKVCGLWPLDPSVFRDDDFAGAKVTEEDLPRKESQTESMSPSVLRSPPPASIHQATEPPTLASTQDSEPPLLTSTQQVSEPRPPASTNQVSGSLPPASTHQVSGPPPPASTHHLSPQLSTTSAPSPVCAPEGSVLSVSTPRTVVQTLGDGRCFFRSIATGLNANLQGAPRNKHGLLEDPELAALETEKADEIRAGVVDYLKEHSEDYRLFDGHISGDLPSGVQYSSLEHRIAAMSNTSTMPGELEIVATSRFLERAVVILTEDKRTIRTYGDNFSEQPPLFVQFQSIGEDVGHYDCVCSVSNNATPAREVSQIISTKGRTNPEIRKFIRSFSPIPKISLKRPRTKRAESATVLTSSPYKKKLLEKEAQKSKQTKRKATKPTKQKQREKSKTRNERESSDDSEDEEWPCLVCCEPYSNTRPGDVWVQCQICLKWAHEECSPGTRQFICPNCESDEESD